MAVILEPLSKNALIHTGFLFLPVKSYMGKRTVSNLEVALGSLTFSALFITLGLSGSEQPPCHLTGLLDTMSQIRAE